MERFTRTVTPPKRSNTTRAATTNLARFSRIDVASSDISGVPVCNRCGAGHRMPALFETAMNAGKNRGNEQQRGYGCEHQPADHGAAERRVLFRAFAQPQ